MTFSCASLCSADESCWQRALIAVWLADDRLCESSDHRVDGSVTPSCCHPRSICPLKRTRGTDFFNIYGSAGVWVFLSVCLAMWLFRTIATLWFKEPQVRLPSTWLMLSPPWFRNLYLGNSCPFRCVGQSSVSLSCGLLQCLSAALDLRLSRWMSGATRSCRGPRGPASGLGADAASSEGSRMVAGHSETISCPEMWVSLSLCRQLLGRGE